jgi:tetratricopeptide (TPR) repeat protein/transcriptional regulator with XRE-family HTH domain
MNGTFGYHACMAALAPATLTPAAFTRFGDLLRFLRRRAQLTQRELSIAVGYNFAQICRLEQGQRLPDPAVVAAVFVLALDLAHEPEWAARLVDLAEAARLERRDAELAALAPLPSTAPQPLALEPGALGALEAIPAATPHEVARPRLVARLHARLAAERHVVLCGLPGMGKTTLAAALAREYAETTPVFWLTFTAGVTTSVEALVRQLSQFLLAHGQRDVHPLLRQSGQALPLDRQLAVIGAALGRLGAASSGWRATPPLLCFDNIHLAQDDPEIVHGLRHLAATCTARMLLIGRENTQTLPGCAQVRLDGLEPDEGQELIAHLARRHDGGPGAPPWATKLLEQTGGSPMLVQLAVGQLLDEAAAPEAFIAQLASQPQIAAYLLETVRRHTSPAAWGLLSFVAVFRQPIDLYDPALVELIQEADGATDLTAALDELIRRHLIDHPTRAQPHRLVRDYVYTALSALPLHRRQLHRVAAEWSEHGLDDPVEASYHYCMAGDVMAASAALADHVETIVESGRAFAAADMAALVLVQARRQRGGTTELLPSLLALHGDLLIHTLRAEESEASYREALRLTSDPAARAQIACRLTRSLAQRGQAAEAVLVAQRAAAALAPSEHGLRAALAAAESCAHLALSSYDAAVQAATQALRLADQLGDNEARLAAEIYARALQVLGTTMRLHRNLNAALRHYRDAIRAAQQAEMSGLALRCRMDEATLLFDHGQYALLLERCAELMPLLQTSGDSYGVGKLYGRIAMSSLLCGDLAAGLEAAEQGYAMRAAIGDAHGLVTAANQRSFILITLDRLVEARSIVEQTLATYQPTGEMHDLGYTLEKLAMIQMLEGDAESAQATLRRALALPVNASDAKLLSDLLHDLAVTQLMTGALEEAHRIISTHSVEGGLWVELEHMLLKGLFALASGDTAAAQVMATELAARARRADVRLYEQHAGQLMTASAAPPPYDWPRLMWVTGR